MRRGSEETLEGDRVTFAPVAIPTTSNRADAERPGIDKAEHMFKAAELGTSSEENDTATSDPQTGVGIPYIARIY